MVLFAAFAQDEELSINALIKRDCLLGIIDALVVELEAATCMERGALPFIVTI